MAESASSLPGYAPLLFLLHHVEFGFSLLQLILLLLDFLQKLLTLLQQAFLKEQERNLRGSIYLNILSIDLIFYCQCIELQNVKYEVSARKIGSTHISKIK